MNKYFVFLVIICLASCSETQPEKEPEKIKPAVVKKDALLLPLEQYFNVVVTDEKTFLSDIGGEITTTMDEDADSMLTERQEKLLQEYPDDLYFYDDRLVIYGRPQAKVYKNSDSRDINKNVQYYLYDINKSIALVRVIKLKSSGWEFLERINLSAHSCIGFPVFSDDSSQVMVASSSVPRELDEPGFQYFTFEDNKYILKWKISLEDWFATDLHWINDSSLACKKVYFSNDPMPADYDSIQYLRLSFK